MRQEIFVLFLSVILGIVQVLLAAAASTKQRGAKWNMSSRDSTMPPLTGVAARLDRALQNFKETFPFFVAAIVVVVATETADKISEVSAWIYLLARIIYIPCYTFNITGVRSLIWLSSLLGILGVLTQSMVS